MLLQRHTHDRGSQGRHDDVKGKTRSALAAGHLNRIMLKPFAVRDNLCVSSLQLLFFRENKRKSLTGHVVVFLQFAVVSRGQKNKGRCRNRGRKFLQITCAVSACLVNTPSSLLV